MITNIYPNSFAGTFATESDGISVQGNFGTDAAKKINLFAGTATKDGIQICTFDVQPFGQVPRYTYREVTDTEALAEAVPIITAEYETVVEEAANPNVEE